VEVKEEVKEEEDWEEESSESEEESEDEEDEMPLAKVRKSAPQHPSPQKSPQGSTTSAPGVDDSWMGGSNPATQGEHVSPYVLYEMMADQGVGTREQLASALGTWGGGMGPWDSTEHVEKESKNEKGNGPN
jgi:hypothetical protein